jgi:hypothetical protein
MTSYLYAHQIRIFDYPRFAEPLRDAIRANAELLAQENGIEVEFIGQDPYPQGRDHCQSSGAPWQPSGPCTATGKPCNYLNQKFCQIVH